MFHRSRCQRGKPSALITLWIFRIIVPLNGRQEFVGGHSFSDDRLAKMLGMGKWVEEVAGFKYSAKPVLSDLIKRYREAEKNQGKAQPPKTLHDNIKQLAELAGLNPTDCCILEFVVLLHSENMLEEAADLLGALSLPQIINVLSVILDIPEQDIRNSLAPNGHLMRSGLMTINHNDMSPLRRRLKLLSDDFADRILTPFSDPMDLLQDVVVLANGPILNMDDYEHVAPSLRVLVPYLHKVNREGLRGVNILFHGPPGTGKSQLARILAQDLSVRLHEVASQDMYGNPVSGEKRLQAFRAAQYFFAQHWGLLLFDECEDVFDDGGGFFGRKSTAQTRKAWINRMLEDNPLPTLWLTNAVSSMDPAFVRRFDMVLELPIPPRRQREKIIRHACGDMLNATGVINLAESEELSPAVITRAANVIRAIRADLPQMKSSRPWRGSSTALWKPRAPSP